ncbi:MAG: glycosylase [Actinobacteria bacterium HGW-Actinobacteria-5]|jgi:predicted GH43/DUF377 family glycosyl hydrolase|nr:MAG: glycosylase [Actinobacteria bacterium HGW-Actinobacteria-5]
MTLSLTDAGVELRSDPERVFLRLFLPGDATPGSSSRTQAVLDRVLALPAADVAQIANEALSRLGERHADLGQVLRRHALTVWRTPEVGLDHDLGVAIGAVFSAEVSPEGAALCNPSVVAHPDQTGLRPGQLRVALSLRLIGEGHRSSIGFCEAIVGPGQRWRFMPRDQPLHLARISGGHWNRDHLSRALEHRGRTDELARTVAQALPADFDSEAVEHAVQQLPPALLHQLDARAQQQLIRVIAGSAYQATFSESSTLSQRTLVPAADEENQGMEDLRLVGFTDAAGHTEYRGTYTAYDGQAIATRLLTTDDFRSFSVQRLTGPCSDSKGVALFPRPVGGVQVALARSDGESITLTTSPDGLDWAPETPLRYPRPHWAIVQSGVCAPPIETDSGWLVITHGVGPTREYSLGALLLDREDPTVVRATLAEPLLRPAPGTSGYVPNVVYSCGATLHDGTIWVPYALADQRIRVGSVPLHALLSGMRPTHSNASYNVQAGLGASNRK